MNLYLAGFKYILHLMRHKIVTWDDFDNVLISPYHDVLNSGQKYRRQFERAFATLGQKRKKVFLDSGAHSIYTLITEKNPGVSVVEFQSFWAYVDGYIDFIKSHESALDVYVTVDVIFDAEKTWDVLKYMESKGVKPLPVYHLYEDIKWLKKYMDDHEYIGVSGMGQAVRTPATYSKFADSVFDVVCDYKGKPLRKIHGFAMTSEEMMQRYPWYSVDSASWNLLAAYGQIQTPWGTFHLTDRVSTRDRLHLLGRSRKMIDQVDECLRDLTGFGAVEIANSKYLRGLVNMRYYTKVGAEIECEAFKRTSVPAL